MSTAYGSAQARTSVITIDAAKMTRYSASAVDARRLVSSVARRPRCSAEWRITDGPMPRSSSPTKARTPPITTQMPYCSVPSESTMIGVSSRPLTIVTA